MVSVDANEVEAYALYIVCRELERIGGSHAIIEGDSFSSIPWALEKSIYPWRIVDWVEEVQDL